MKIRIELPKPWGTISVLGGPTVVRKIQRAFARYRSERLTEKQVMALFHTGGIEISELIRDILIVDGASPLIEVVLET